MNSVEQWSFWLIVQSGGELRCTRMQKQMEKIQYGVFVWLPLQVTEIFQLWLIVLKLQTNAEVEQLYKLNQKPMKTTQDQGTNAERLSLNAGC